MGRPIMVATRAFDFLLNQADYLHAEQDLRVLLDHFGSTFTALGGVESAVLNEWNRLVTRDDVLRVLPVAELLFELTCISSTTTSALMLLTALVQAAAMDAVFSE